MPEHARPTGEAVAREMYRRQREEDYRDRYERADERVPVQLFTVSVRDDVQNSHDDASDDRHLDQ
ncbi:MAG TPA: hypothetical protein VII66_10320 [Gemmatimonadaceae bacterium]